MPILQLLAVTIVTGLGATLPDPLAPVVALPAVFPFFVVLAAGEEIGWMGWIYEPLQTRWGAVGGSVILGVIWALWHVPFFKFLFPDPTVRVALLITLVGTRVLMAWVFTNTGRSVLVATLFHAVDNAAMLTLPQVQQSPEGAVTLLVLVLTAAVVVSGLWPTTLARFRLGRQQGA